WQLLKADDASVVSHPQIGDTWETELSRRAFYPLTFPVTVGPGSISVAVTVGAGLARQTAYAAIDLASNLAGVAARALSVSLSYRFAGRLIAALGATASTVFLRLSSFILLCVGVGILWSGLAELLRSIVLSR